MQVNFEDEECDKIANAQIKAAEAASKLANPPTPTQLAVLAADEAAAAASTVSVGGAVSFARW